MKLPLLLLCLCRASAFWWLLGGYLHDRQIRAFRITADELGNARGIEVFKGGRYGNAYYRFLLKWKRVSLRAQFRWWRGVMRCSHSHVELWTGWLCLSNKPALAALLKAWRADPGHWVWLPGDGPECLSTRDPKVRAVHAALSRRRTKL